TNRPELFVRNPGWHAFFDQIPDMAETTRRKVLDMLIADKMLGQTFHAPFPALGHMEKDGQGYRFVQAPWSPAVCPARRILNGEKRVIFRVGGRRSSSLAMNLKTAKATGLHIPPLRADEVIE